MGSWVAFGWSHCGIWEMEGSGKEELRRADGTQEQEVRVPVLLEQSAPAAPVSASEAVVEEGEAKEQAQERSGSASYLAAIDQGTTSTRFIVYDTAAKVVASHQLEFPQIYPQAGYLLFLALTLFLLSIAHSCVLCLYKSKPCECPNFTSLTCEDYQAFASCGSAISRSILNLLFSSR